MEQIKYGGDYERRRHNFARECYDKYPDPEEIAIDDVMDDFQEFATKNGLGIKEIDRGEDIRPIEQRKWRRYQVFIENVDEKGITRNVALIGESEWDIEHAYQDSLFRVKAFFEQQP